MKKKKLSKNAKPVDDEQNAVAENMKKTPPPPIISSSATPKKLKCGSEIDEIFAGKKRKKTEKFEDVVGEPKREAMKNNKRKDRKVCNENGSTGGLRCRKRTGDGLVMYSEEELGIGRADAGGTPLCPFDCDCCF